MFTLSQMTAFNLQNVSKYAYINYVITILFLADDTTQEVIHLDKNMMLLQSAYQKLISYITWT